MIKGIILYNLIISWVILRIIGLFPKSEASCSHGSVHLRPEVPHPWRSPESPGHEVSRNQLGVRVTCGDLELWRLWDIDEMRNVPGNVSQAVQKLKSFLQDLLYERWKMTGSMILSHQLWLESSTETVPKTVPQTVSLHARKMHLDTILPFPNLTTALKTVPNYDSYLVVVKHRPANVPSATVQWIPWRWSGSAGSTEEIQQNPPKTSSQLEDKDPQILYTVQ